MRTSRLRVPGGIVPEAQLEIADPEDPELDTPVGVDVRPAAEPGRRDGLTADGRLVELGRLLDVFGDEADARKVRPAVEWWRRDLPSSRPR